MDLLTLFLISLGLNLLMFIPAFIFKTDKLTDASYGITFILLSLIAVYFNSKDFWKYVLLIMVSLWALRLLSYLLIRIIRFGKDKRFDGMRENFFSFLKFWILQGISVFIILIPSLYFFNSETIKINILSIIGLLIFITGLFIEFFADIQKFKFITNKKNKGKWIDKGLWRYSRHPNYFGESLVWIGIYFFTFSSLNSIEKLISLLSPAFILILLLFISGIPPLEKRADEKFGNNKDYKKYKKQTNIFFIWFRKK